MGWLADRAGRARAQMSITFLNAQFSGGRIGSLRVRGARIAALDVDPEPSDAVVDLHGDRLLPGLINAHDHLQLNSLPDHETPKFYQHARHWIAEVDRRRRTDPQFEAGASVARDERLLFGGLKNLLSGVTTVAHHDPLYPFLTQAGYPIAVVRDYGWSHSLYVDGERSVAESYRATPAAWPWIVHAAEGQDQEAADEFERLEALGCLRSEHLAGPWHCAGSSAARSARGRRKRADLVPFLEYALVRQDRPGGRSRLEASRCAGNRLALERRSGPAR